MMFSVYRSCFHSYTFCSHNLVPLRYVRNASKRITALKTIKNFQMKNIDDDYEKPFDLDEIKKKIRENDPEIEDTFTKDVGIDTLLAESERLYDMHASEEKGMKSKIKKKIVARKYFNAGKETCLLTHAAKEQIKHLHNLDPLEWNPETLSKSFPISVEGVKKLLRSKFVLTDPEKIREYDEDVRKKWESLKSGEISDSISIHTQCLWKNGKLLKENYNGNPSLPSVPDVIPPKVIEVASPRPLGEYSAIVKKYVAYKTQREVANCKSSELTVKTDNDNHDENQNKSFNSDTESKNLIKKSKGFKEDRVYKKKNMDDDELELPFSQFKENLKEQLKVEGPKSNSSEEFYNWIEENSNEKKKYSKNSVFDPKEFVPKIPKYNKENIELKQDRSNSTDTFYLYSDELGYQYPGGHTIKRKIKIPVKSKQKGMTYKVGKCVYDEDGEFLYKLPVS